MLSHSIELSAKEKHKKTDHTWAAHHQQKGNPRIIDQCMIDNRNGTLQLMHSGEYRFAENLTGTIVIATSSVCLDLNCFTLNANGKSNAIVIQNAESVKVFNGTIYNSTEAGISVTGSTSISLYNLFMHDHALDAIFQQDSTDLHIDTIDFIGTNAPATAAGAHATSAFNSAGKSKTGISAPRKSALAASTNFFGESALRFDTCSNITIKDCNMSGFLSSSSAIIEFLSSDCITMDDVNVCGNLKSLSAANGALDASAAFVYALLCTGIDFKRVKANINTIDNLISGNQTFSAIDLIGCDSCSLHQCDTSDNLNIAGTALPAIGQDIVLFISLCTNVTVTEHKSNSHSVKGPITSLFPIGVLESRSVVLDRCQANNNLAASMPLNPASNSTFRGIALTTFTPTVEQLADNVVRNCQANFNRIEDGGAGRVQGGRFCRLLSITLAALGIDESVVIDNCQANHNSIGSTGDNQRIYGIHFNRYRNVTVTNSTGDSNTGGEYAVGMKASTGPVGGSRTLNATVRNCSASSNNGYGFQVGDVDSLSPIRLANISILGCVANKNSHAKLSAVGIFLSPEPSTPEFYRNILIKDCQVNETSATGSSAALAAGIKAQQASNVVIEDTIINNTNNLVNVPTTAPGYGILLDRCTDSKVIRCQLSENKSSGVQLKGANQTISVIDSTATSNDKGFSVTTPDALANGLFQGNRAINNKSVGFEQIVPTTIPATLLTTGYVSNYAQGNGTDYSITGGLIGLQKLSFATATITKVDGMGNDAVSYWSNITALPS